MEQFDNLGEHHKDREENVDSKDLSEEERAILIYLEKGDDISYYEIKDKLLNLSVISRRFLELPEIKAFMRKVFCEYISDGDINKAFKFKDKFDMSEEVLMLPEVRESVLNIMKKTYAWDILKLKKQFGFGSEILEISEIKEIIKNNILEMISLRHPHALETKNNIKESFSWEDEAYRNLFIKDVFPELRDIMALENLMDDFDLPDEVAQSDSMQEVVLKKIKNLIYSLVDAQKVLDLKDKYKIPDDKFKTLVKTMIAEEVRGRQNYRPQELRNVLNRLVYLIGIDEVSLSSEVQEAVIDRVLEFLSKGKDPRMASAIINTLGLDNFIFQLPEIQEGIKNAIVDKLLNGNIYFALVVTKELELSDKFLKSPEVQKATKEAISYIVKRSGNIDNILEASKTFGLSEEDFREGLIMGVVACLDSRRSYYNKIARVWNHPDLAGYREHVFDSPEVKDTFRKMVIETIINGQASSYTSIERFFNVSEEIAEVPEVQKKFLEFLHKTPKPDIYWIKSLFPKIFKYLTNVPKIREASTTAIINAILEADYDLSKALQEDFKVSLEYVYQFLPNDQKTRIDMLFERAPKFSEKIFSSTEVFASLLELSFEDVQILLDRPNLLEALENNPSMGIKLLVQYPKLSEEYRENIDTSLEFKNKILEEDSDIEASSHEFRVRMQESLLSYKRNSEIVSELQAAGVNTEEWLNYSEEYLFELGGKEASYAELIKTPSERIKKILQKYEEDVRSVLMSHKDNLAGKSVFLVDTQGIEEKINQMQELMQQADEAGDEKRAQGILRGIESLKKQVENPKVVSAWFKIMSDINTVSKLFGKVEEINNQIMALEEESSALAKQDSNEARKKMFANKEKVAKLSKDFVSVLETTSGRMDILIPSIENILSQVAGEGNAEETIAELKERLAEDMEHFTSDRTTLRNILKMDKDETGGDAEGTLLKIKVWDRNPDVDLYMGNYSDCCVRIDSEYHGLESPISDYITDLGVQIVAIYDEKTKNPFAAAWCYIGKDKDGGKAFVVDNIEASGPCMKYKDDIQSRLKEYIERYAEKSGLQNISQGPYNNDIEITDSLEERYLKLGGYNTEDGYYLEAEPAEDDEDDEEDDPIILHDEEDDELQERRFIDQYSRTQENIVNIEEALNRARLD